MLCKLRYSLTTLAAIALVAASASGSAQQAQAKSKNAISTSSTDVRPWTTTHANRSAGRNDGYVQQSKQGGQKKKR
jgi:hypothetical protein